MSENSRADKILLRASETSSPESEWPYSKVEVNTPFGFVHLAQLDASTERDADSFWAACIRRDDFIAPLHGTMEATDYAALLKAFDIVRDDLKRARSVVCVSAPPRVEEAFCLENSCSECFGRVLLFRSRTDAFFLHLHRQS